MPKELLNAVLSDSLSEVENVLKKINARGFFKSKIKVDLAEALSAAIARQSLQSVYMVKLLLKNKAPITPALFKQALLTDNQPIILAMLSYLKREAAYHVIPNDLTDDQQRLILNKLVLLLQEEEQYNPEIEKLLAKLNIPLYPAIKDKLSILSAAQKRMLMKFAAINGQLDLMEALVADGLSPEVFIGNYTALHYAAKYGRTEIVQFLLKHGAYSLALSRNFSLIFMPLEKPLAWAIKNQQWDVVFLLIEHSKVTPSERYSTKDRDAYVQMDPHVASYFERYPFNEQATTFALHDACWQGDLAAVKQAVESDANVNQRRQPDHYEWMSQAEYYNLGSKNPGFFEVKLGVMLNKMADMPTTAEQYIAYEQQMCYASQGTPLHYAVLRGSADMVVYLLNQPGVRVNALNLRNQTPLDVVEEALKENPRSTHFKRPEWIKIKNSLENRGGKCYRYAQMEMQQVKTLKEEVLRSETKSVQEPGSPIMLPEVIKSAPIPKETTEPKFILDLTKISKPGPQKLKSPLSVEDVIKLINDLPNPTVEFSAAKEPKKPEKIALANFSRAQ